MARTADRDAPKLGRSHPCQVPACVIRILNAQSASWGLEGMLDWGNGTIRRRGGLILASRHISWSATCLKKYTRRTTTVVPPNAP